MAVLASLLLGMGMTLLVLTLAILYIVIVVIGVARLGTIVEERVRKGRKRKREAPESDILTRKPQKSS